jgi:septum formation protein
LIELEPKINLFINNIYANDIISPDEDESIKKKEKPHLLSKRLALAKGLEIYNKITNNYNNFIKDGIILCADTVCSRGSIILDKAISNDDVKNHLMILSNRNHNIFTSVFIMNCSDMKHSVKTVHTKIKFKTLTKNEIDKYVSTEEGLNKAGGYGIQGYAESFVEKINGSYSNIIGMPLLVVKNLLISYGYNC